MGKESNPIDIMMPVIAISIAIIVVMIIGAMFFQGGVGVNRPAFGEVTISRKSSIFPAFSSVILVIGVISAIYLFRRYLFKKRSVRIG